MKKKKKAKKKRRSTAWKDLEKYTAEYLEGTRILRGANFSASLPDVVADGSVIGLTNTSILVECKHSKNQPFVDLLKDTLTGFGLVKDEELGELLFWKFEETKELFNPSKLKDNVAKAEYFLKEVPQYIRDNYHQACGYHIIGLVPLGNHMFRFVVMAKKSCSTRIAYTTRDQISQIVP